MIFITSCLIWLFHANIRENVPLYKHLVGVVASRINSRLDKDPDARSSGDIMISGTQQPFSCNHLLAFSYHDRNAGIIVNTCGWIEDKGFDIIMHTIHTLSIDIVLGT